MAASSKHSDSSQPEGTKSLPQFRFRLRVSRLVGIRTYPHSEATVVSDAANGAFEKVLVALGKPPIDNRRELTVLSIDEVTDLVATDPKATTDLSNPPEHGQLTKEGE